MRWRMAAICMFVVACMNGTSIATLSSATAVETEKLMATFTNELAKYDKAHDDSVSDLREQYIGALAALQQKFMSAGSLDAVLAIKKESARFAADRSLRTGDLVAEPADLLSIQQQFIRKLEGLPALRAAKVVRLAELYAKSLRSLEENLTKQAMLDDAIAVKAIREGVPALPAVAGASFILSTTSQTAGGATNTIPVAGAGVTPASPNTPSIPDRKTGKKYAGSSSTRVRDQFDTFLKAIQRQDWAGAEAIVDPATLKAQGSQRVQGFIKGLAGRLGGEGGSRSVELRNVVVAEDDRTASGSPSVKTKEDWRDLRPLKWTQSEGDWYIDIQATMAERREFRRNEGRDDRGGRADGGQR